MSIKDVLFAFDGTIGRRDYWLKGLIVVGVYFLAIQAFTIILFQLPSTLLGISLLLFMLLVIPSYLLGCWALLAVAAKRLQDLEKRGYWCLLALVPVFGQLFLLALGLINSKSREVPTTTL